jgi:peptidoglycan/xylan/chitin deacetylase (PgdA/CDA1 family)
MSPNADSRHGAESDAAGARESMPARRRALLGLHSFLHASGADAAFAAVRRGSGATMLMYHSIAADDDARWIDPRNRMSPGAFRRQMEYIARRRRVASLDELVDGLESGRELPRGSVVVTIDDGYRDALTVAAPILAEYRIPAVLYLATGYVERTENQWVDQLYSIFRARERDRLKLPWEREQRGIDAAYARASAYDAVRARLLSSAYEDRAALLGDIRDQLRPSGEAPRLTLSWDEVRELKAAYPSIAIGGHTRSHVDLSSIRPETAEAEIADCSSDILDAIGKRPIHFSFPYNRTGPGFADALERSGFRSGAASGVESLIRPGAPRFALPRIEAPASLERLGFYTSGAYPGLSLALTGRA